MAHLISEPDLSSCHTWYHSDRQSETHPGKPDRVKSSVLAREDQSLMSPSPQEVCCLWQYEGKHTVYVILYATERYAKLPRAFVLLTCQAAVRQVQVVKRHSTGT